MKIGKIRFNVCQLLNEKVDRDRRKGETGSARDIGCGTQELQEHTWTTTYRKVSQLLQTGCAASATTRGTIWVV